MCIQDANNPLEIPSKTVLEAHSARQQESLQSTNSYRTFHSPRLDSLRITGTFGTLGDRSWPAIASGISVVSKRCVFGWHWR